MYKYIFFDLDGTIVDSGPGITNSVEYALKKFGIDVPDKSELNKFIGPPLKNSFQEFYNMNDEDSSLAVKYYREYYGDKGVFECEVYPGIPELLEKIRNNGNVIALATSKPEFYANQILEHFGLTKYFSFIAGLDMSDLKSTKEAIIQKAITGLEISDNSQIVMIGDRKHDIIGSKAHNIDCVAVLFGYGSREEFEEYGAKYIAADTNEIFNICTDLR